MDTITQKDFANIFAKGKEKNPPFFKRLIHFNGSVGFQEIDMKDDVYVISNEDYDNVEDLMCHNEILRVAIQDYGENPRYSKIIINAARPYDIGGIEIQILEVK